MKLMYEDKSVHTRLAGIVNAFSSGRTAATAKRWQRQQLEIIWNLSSDAQKKLILFQRSLREDLI